MRIEDAGFASTVLTGITILVNEQAVVNGALKVGSTTESCEVTTQASLVEITNGGLSGVVTTSELHQFPLNGRDLFQLFGRAAANAG